VGKGTSSGPPGSTRVIPNPAESKGSGNVPQPGPRTISTGGGGYKKLAASGRTTEVMERKSDGQHTQILNPSGKVQREEVQKKDGTVQTTHYAPNGKPTQQVVVGKDRSSQDRTVQSTTFRYGRDGKERIRETINTDARGRSVSKTIVVKQTTIIKNTTIKRNSEIVRNYDRGRFGFVYHPAYVAHPHVFVSWYRPYWYTPAGVLIVHPFHYTWGWENYGWYHRYHGAYWATYDVYPAPSYWLTDWVIADYLADNYAASVSVAQAQEEARFAREDAVNARQAADQARGQAEIDEAKRAQAEAEFRAKNAEERLAQAKLQEPAAGKPNLVATPLSQETQEDFRHQIERTIAEKQEYAAQIDKGGKPLPPDLSRALAEPERIYPVSRTLDVTLAASANRAGNLTEGDMLRVEPGQDSILKTANENTLVTMRVMASKGEVDEVKAGTLVSVPLRDLQDFDSEFQAKLDVGLAEADKNMDKFRKGAL
jgi:hypothetical protein